MTRVEIYTTSICPYCARAKKLLAKKNVQFIEYDVGETPALREKMIARAAGRTSVPQIFINDAPIGGCDDLYALDRAHKLDPMLQGIAS